MYIKYIGLFYISQLTSYLHSKILTNNNVTSKSHHRIREIQYTLKQNICSINELTIFTRKVNRKRKVIGSQKNKIVYELKGIPIPPVGEHRKRTPKKLSYLSFYFTKY